jgi:hypothetical protein
VGIELRLLGEERWRDNAVVGDRPQALLAALAAVRRWGMAVPTTPLERRELHPDDPWTRSRRRRFEATPTFTGGDADMQVRSQRSRPPHLVQRLMIRGGLPAE